MHSGFGLALCLGLLITAIQSNADLSEIGPALTRFEEFQESTFAYDGMTTRTRGRVIADKFQKLGFPEYIDSVEVRTDEELDLLFRAARAVHFYGDGHRGSVEWMQKILDELDARGLVEQRHVEQTFHAWVAVREVHRAEQVRSTFPERGLPQAPEIVSRAGAGLEGPTALRIDANNENRFVREKISLENEILVISNPFACHFSRQAISEIATEPALRELFRARGIFLMDQGSILSYERLRDWKHESDFDLKVAYHQSEWPDIDHWATPTFYIFENGNLIKSLSGWNQDTRLGLVRYLETEAAGGERQ